MNKRIKMVRDSHNLTQDAFGKRIGSARNTIANYENGNRVPSNAVVKSICKEYGINETWLRTGKEEMFVPITRENEIAKLTMKCLEDEPDSFRNKLVSTLARLSEDDWGVLERIAKDLVGE